MRDTGIGLVCYKNAWGSIYKPKIFSKKTLHQQRKTINPNRRRFTMNELLEFLKSRIKPSNDKREIEQQIADLVYSEVPVKIINKALLEGNNLQRGLVNFGFVFGFEELKNIQREDLLIANIICENREFIRNFIIEED